MQSRIRFVAGNVFVIGSMMLASGCYEQLEPEQPQAAAGPQSPGPVQTGPITGQATQGGGSALGGAKRAATNVVNQAEEASRRAAEDAGSDDE